MRLIDKDVIITEINRLHKAHSGKYGCDEVWLNLEYLEDFIDTLEVKEVDLEKEYEEFVVDDPIFGNFITNDTMGMELAKHFFELGIQVNNKAQKGEEI